MVEDEALIADLVAAGLAEAGYVVVAAHDTESAIAILDMDDAVFRAVVTDVNLAADKLTGGTLPVAHAN